MYTRSINFSNKSASRNSKSTPLLFRLLVLLLYCPFCLQTNTKVLESRAIQESLRRRRECLNCSSRFTTYEKAVFQLKVLKRDGREQEFDLAKIQRGIEKACNKIDPAILSNLSQKIEQKILHKKTNSVKSTEIGNIVLQELKKFDQMAYLRFASVYKSIDDPKLLKKELNLIINQK